MLVQYVTDWQPTRKLIEDLAVAKWLPRSTWFSAYLEFIICFLPSFGTENSQNVWKLVVSKKWQEMSRLMTKPTKDCVLSEDAQWVAKDLSFLRADSEDSDQTGRMPRLTWVFPGRTWHFVGFVIRQFKCACWSMLSSVAARKTSKIELKNSFSCKKKKKEKIFHLNVSYEPHHYKTCLCCMQINKDADQPAHLRSLVSGIVIRCQYSKMPIVVISNIKRLYIASVTGQAPPKTGFLVTWFM